VAQARGPAYRGPITWEARRPRGPTPALALVHQTRMPRMPAYHRRAVSRTSARWLLAAIVIGMAVAGVVHATGAPASDVAMLTSTIVAAAGFFGAAGSSELRGSMLLLGWSATAWVAGVASWLGFEALSQAA
jgi:hypothetical protein